MQAASHENQVFKTGSHPHPLQLQTQKAAPCNQNHSQHPHHRHRLLKSSQNPDPTALTSNPTASSQVAASSLPHTAENVARERPHSQVSSDPKSPTAGGTNTSVNKAPALLSSSIHLRKDNEKRSSKSTSSSVPQPVIVRTYTPAESRTSSLTQLSSPPPLLPSQSLFSSASLLNLISTLTAPRTQALTPSSSSRPPPSSVPLLGQSKSGQHLQRQSSPSPAATAARFAMTENSHLPSVDAFAFKNILRAVDPEIQPALDAIAEICSRSKLSLADEYSAHMPPLGEISAFRYSTHPYRASVGNGAGNVSIAAGGLEGALPSVPEASSSSERLASEERYNSKSLGNSRNPDGEKSKDDYDSANAISPPESNHGKQISPHLSWQGYENDSTTKGSVGNSNLKTTMAPFAYETNDHSKRRSSIVLLSSASESVCPTASTTTTAVDGTVPKLEDAAVVSRSVIGTPNDVTLGRKLFRSNISSWVIWGPSTQKGETLRQLPEDARTAEAKLSGILRDAGSATKGNDFGKR